MELFCLKNGIKFKFFPNQILKLFKIGYCFPLNSSMQAAEI